jgi:hypothetical protein
MSSTNRYQGVDPVLTNVSIGYQNSAYVAEQLFPTLPVAKQSGKHFIYDKGKFRVNDNLRGSGAASKEVTLNLTTGLPYFCEDHALKQFVTDEDMDGAVAPMDPMVDATENVTEMHMVAREVELAASLTSTGVMTQNTTLSGSSQWSDYQNSDPFTNIETGKQTIHSAIHVDPNVLVLPKQVWDKLKHHPAFLERVKYSQKGVISEDLLASLVGVDRVIIAAAGKNAAVEGQTDSMSYIWGKDAILAYINPRLGQKMITLGLTYQWKTRKVEKLRGTNEEDRKGTYVRVGDHYYDMNLVSASAGYLMKAVVA